MFIVHQSCVGVPCNTYQSVDRISKSTSRYPFTFYLISNIVMHFLCFFGLLGECWLWIILATKIMHNIVSCESVLGLVEKQTAETTFQCVGFLVFVALHWWCAKAMANVYAANASATRWSQRIWLNSILESSASAMTSAANSTKNRSVEVWSCLCTLESVFGFV